LFVCLLVRSKMQKKNKMQTKNKKQNKPQHNKTKK